MHTPLQALPPCMSSRIITMETISLSWQKHSVQSQMRVREHPFQMDLFIQESPLNLHSLILMAHIVSDKVIYSYNPFIHCSRFPTCSLLLWIPSSTTLSIRS